MKPRYSVIVPVFKDWEHVGKLVERLHRQEVPAGNFEVLLVDNGSDTIPRLELPANFRLLVCRTPGSYAARNHGAAAAQGAWLAFTDADCLPERDWLARIAAAAGQAGMEECIIAGSVEIVQRSQHPNAYEIYDLLKGIPQALYVRRGYGVTANLAVSADLFRKVGGFDPSRFSGGDADFCRRAGSLNHQVVFLPEARVGHRSRSSWQDIATKARRVKGGQIAAGARKRRLAYAARTLLPPGRAAWRFLYSRRYPFRYRIVAVAVLLRVWLLEIAEMFRLLLGSAAERR